MKLINMTRVGSNQQPSYQKSSKAIAGLPLPPVNELYKYILCEILGAWPASAGRVSGDAHESWI